MRASTVTEPPFERWTRTCAGLGIAEVRRREVADETRRLRQRVANRPLDPRMRPVALRKHE